MKKNIPSNFDFYKDQVVSGEYLVGGMDTPPTRTPIDCPDDYPPPPCGCFQMDGDVPSAGVYSATSGANFFNGIFGMNTHVSVNPVTGVTTIRKVSKRRF